MTSKALFLAALIGVALVTPGQSATKKPAGATSGTVVTGLLAMSAFDPLLDREYILNVIEAKDRVTIQLFRTDGRQKINAVLVRKDADSEFCVSEVRTVPPMSPTTSTNANCTAAYALAMLSHGNDKPVDGYKRLKLRGLLDADGNVGIVISLPPYSVWDTGDYTITPKGKILRFERWY